MADGRFSFQRISGRLSFPFRLYCQRSSRISSAISSSNRWETPAVTSVSTLGWAWQSRR